MTRAETATVVTASTSASTVVAPSRQKGVSIASLTALDDRRLEILLRQQFKKIAHWVSQQTVMMKSKIKYDVVDKNVHGPKIVN